MFLYLLFSSYVGIFLQFYMKDTRQHLLLFDVTLLKPGSRCGLV
jgi:hypothetical protein